VELSERLIRNAVLSAMDAVEHYAAFLSEVACGERSPLDAARAAEATRAAQD
jgi:hypothetical protein